MSFYVVNWLHSLIKLIGKYFVNINYYSYNLAVCDKDAFRTVLSRIRNKSFVDHSYLPRGGSRYNLCQLD